MTGVMPEPPEISRTWVGSGLGSVKSPSACDRCTTSPTRASVDQVGLTCPSGLARMVRVMRSLGPDSGEDTEKQRVRRAPSTSTPTWTYWPDSWPFQPRDGLRVTVATGSPARVSRVMSTMRARTSWTTHMGLASSR